MYYVVLHPFALARPSVRGSNGIHIFYWIISTVHRRTDETLLALLLFVTGSILDYKLLKTEQKWCASGTRESLCVMDFYYNI